MISLVPSESWGGFKWVRASARKWGVGPCPAQCIWQGSGFAADQTNAMLAVGGTSCISLISVAAADENSLTPLHRLLPAETASLGFGGSPVGGSDKNFHFTFFRHFCVGVVSLPSGRCGCVGTTPRGVYFGRKTAFSERVLCTDERTVPSCTQCFFGVPAWGWYHYPRRALHAVETLDARGSRWLICRFYAATVLALCGQNIHGGYTRHPNPEPRTQRLTRRNTGRFPRPRHRQGR